MHSRTSNRATLVTLATAVAVVVVGVLAAVTWWPGGTDDEQEGPVETVFMGDSITWADSTSVTGTPGEGSWVRWAVSGPRSPWRFEADVAVPGQTLGEMEERFERDVLARRPEAVVIMGGTNDVLRQLPLEVSVESLRRMAEAARDAGARVWIIGPPPIGAVWGRSVAPLAAAAEQVAADTGATYVPVAGLTGPTGEWLEGLSWDGVHPTEAGARALADAILSALD
ncbi:hypothetical protein FB382_000096 [Nocardioides ginsengisegetis]|uniref:SGNH hydrolase-type esterase domain-containing protein n=1 Tax=Nocardioides ginsengisegetis TaxID=661491 RepID=A0A7W3IW72_9ACTN|nr:hypothetical protein [Nocardioides ginsengisegetis]